MKYWLTLFVVVFAVLGCKDSTTSTQEEDKTYNSPMEMIPDMLRGINLGNTLEPPLEGGWNNEPAKEYYFDDYKAAGFTTVRVPVRWDEHTQKAPPYSVNTAWMDRVEQVVDWGLERDLFIILNAHHDDWIKQDFSVEHQARFDSIWVQISERFKDKSEKLLFEIINEPHGLTKEEVDLLNFNTLQTIRKTNPDRVVIYSGNDYSGLQYMLNARILEDPNIMAYFHMYDPWEFAGEGNGTWGTNTDREDIDRKFAQAAAFMDDHNIPVMISEFGAIHDNDFNSRMIHYYTYVESSIRHNIMFQVWDDGGMFRVYEREFSDWQEVKDILIHTYPDSPTNLRVSKSAGAIDLRWTNRTSLSYTTQIQRRVSSAFRFLPLAELGEGVSSYSDTEINTDLSYDYRIIQIIENETDRYSYPVRIE